MKTFLILAVTVTLALVIPAPLLAQGPAKAPLAEKTSATKPIPMWIEVDTIDYAAKTFTHSNANGTVVKFVLTATTEIQNEKAPARFTDIKVKDMVSGLRIKKSPTEYEVVKITKFAPKAGKSAKE